MSKPYPADILKKLRSAVSVWQDTDPTLKFGTLSLTDLEATLERGEALRDQIRSAEIDLMSLRNQRDDLYSEGWNYLVRLRAGMKATYGDDSSVYELVGGTRRSERKPRSRRKEAQPA